MYTILTIGALPPPFNGMSVFFEGFCKSKLKDEFNLVVLDITDRRELSNIGKLDLMNIWLAIKHGFLFLLLLTKHDPDIVYLPIAQGLLGFLRDCLFLIPSRIFGYPVVVHLHGSEFQDFYQRNTKVMKRITKFALEKVACAIVLGSKIVSEFEGIIPGDNVEIVPNFHNDLNDNSVCRERWKEHVVQIGYLSSIKPRKGLLEIVHAIPDVLNQFPNTQFVFAGEVCDEAYFNDIKRFIDEHGLNNNVRFEGVIYGSEKIHFFNSTDVFCFIPNEPEGQPLAIIEAMSCGLSVISTDQGAISDIVIEGETGYLVQPGNQDELVSKLVELIVDTEKRIEMGLKGRLYIEEYFSIDKWERTMGRLFKDVIKRR